MLRITHLAFAELSQKMNMNNVYNYYCSVLLLQHSYYLLAPGDIQRQLWTLQNNN